ncbi:MAG: LysR family transcriptional regulator [Flavonifractor plautii]
MDVKQMTYILTIAQEGGISKAAAKLFITQSAPGSAASEAGA